MPDYAIFSRYSLLQLGVNPVAFKTIGEAKNYIKRSINSSYKSGECSDPKI